MSAVESYAEKVVDAIRIAIGPQPAVLHEPTFDGNEWMYVKDCLDSTFVSSVGKYVDKFEFELAKFTGAKYAVALVNGTAALHVALILAGVRHDDEVLIPALTFVATANAVAYCDATPHFVDSGECQLNIDVEKLRSYLIGHTLQRGNQCINRLTGKVIRALVPMHTFGHPADLDALLAIARDFNIVLVEDAAESLGSYYHDQHTGTFGLLGALSFNGNKTITTGGGGAILTNDESVARRAKHLTTTAKLPHAWEYNHDQVAYNYRLPNINAALGCAQLERLPEILSAKRALYKQYQIAFASLPGINLIAEPKNCRSNYWLQTLALSPKESGQRDLILKVTNEAGYMTRPVWTLMHKLNMFKSCPRMDLSGATRLSKALINIPSSAKLVSNKL